MSLSSLGFLFDEAGKNIRRNGLMSLAALSTVAISMAVLGGALYFVYRLHQFADAQPRQFEIQVFLQTETPREKVMEIKRRIQTVPYVAHVTLYSKEKALADLEERDRTAGSAITEAVGDRKSVV